MKEGGYMIKKKSRIPKFKTYEEEANFWDTHEFTEFEDELEDVEIIFELNKPRDETVILRVQKDIKDKIEKVARNRGLNLSTLARMWLMEKLQENLGRAKA
jgi:predicted DNA binding CopG/RHH family protein